MLKENVFKIISHVMDVPFEEVNEKSSPESLEVWDSLKHMNLVLALEEVFKIRFTDEEILKLGNAGIIFQTLQEKV